MGLYSMMRTSASGMAAQANRLGTVADNIANSATAGYKRASAEFSSLILESGGAEYVSGSVETSIRHFNGEQGAFKFTTSSTDLAVKGNGFFIVQGAGGQTYLTRAGSFVRDGDGDLINAAGFKLMGYSLAAGAPNVVTNGIGGLEPVNIGDFALQADPSSAGHIYVNLPSNGNVIAAADLPSANAAAATYNGKTSLVTYDNLGNEVTLDVYASKTAASTWEIAVYDHAAAGAGGGFPYSSAALGTTTLTFDGQGQFAAASPTSLSLNIPNGAAFTLDLSQSSQLATDYTVLSAGVNGNAPSGVDHVEIADDGNMYAVFENGQRRAVYRIPLANVPSPENLEALAGNVFGLGSDSGDMQIGFAGSSGFGTMVAGALEQSTVDLASELTNMIESERNYTANSKVFQTGAELMDVLVNLKR
jgi:flagellar hook protein FlgE